MSFNRNKNYGVHNPCWGCNRRCEGCHSSCKDYKDYNLDMDSYHARKEEERELYSTGMRSRESNRQRYLKRVKEMRPLYNAE